MDAILAEDVSKEYDDVRALDDVSLSVRESEIFGLLGPNGAGKSTLIKIVTTLLKPTSGHVLVFSHDVDRESFEVRKLLGYSPQEVALDGYQTARQMLKMLGTFYHVPKTEIDQAVDAALGIVDLSDRAESLIKTFSGGMKKRLEIATSLLHKPRLLILDEPTLGLDVDKRFEIWNYIRRIREAGTTVMLTTHYLEEAEELCDRIAIIHQGKIRAIGDQNSLKSSVGGDLLRIKLSQSANVNSIKNDSGSQLTILRDLVPLTQETTYDASGRTLSARVSKGISDLEKLIPILKQRNLESSIESVSFAKHSLSDVYLHYTQSKEEFTHEQSKHSMAY
ncbi:MAG: ATP-binding cassette domain-containing protein [Thaumarchaeota archaeon]|nr:ATP-binding cassette domain-containing protein [Nitrososphaerota archaeon]